MARKNNTRTEPYNVQVDRKQLARAKDLVNLPEAVRALVAKIVEEKLCPCCGEPIKAKK